MKEMKIYKQCRTVKVRYEGKGRKKREKIKVEGESRNHAPYPPRVYRTRSSNILASPIARV